MRINSIQQYQCYTNNSFKGAISPEVIQLINKSAKDEACRYVSSLERGVVAEKNEILKIKKAWDEALTALSEKVKQMHPDTNMYMVKGAYGACNKTGRSIDFRFENKKLDSYVVFGNIREDSIYPITSKDFAPYPITINPAWIDEKILKAAISNFKAKMQKNDMVNYEYRLNNILEYQSQLSSVSEDKAIQNKIELETAIVEAKKRIEYQDMLKQVGQKNMEIIDEVFGTDK